MATWQRNHRGPAANTNSNRASPRKTGVNDRASYL
jgi:hypothetical protein